MPGPKTHDIFYKNLPFIDLHGVDREIARVMTEDFINENYILGNNKFVIIHGIGEGIVKQSVYNTLLKNRKVKKYYIDMYNEGCTVVELKVDENGKR